MSFDKLKPQPTFANPDAEAYARKAFEWSREAAERVRYLGDVSYGGEERQLLDIYLPDDSAPDGLPVLIFLHGGRWRAGYKEWNGFMAPMILGSPAILVSASYGLSPEHRFPVQLHDVLAAVGWVHAHIGEYGGAPDRLFLGGHSAGGHLSALATLRRDLHAAFGIPDGAIKGCFPMSGTMNFDLPDVRPGSEEEQIRNILLADLAQAPEASPIRYVDGNRVPFYLSFGEHDYPRVIASNRAMIAALGEQPGTAHWIEYEGLDHFAVHLQLNDPVSPWYDVLRAWMADPPSA
jgi:acetyl esterase/lipase